MEFIDTHAHLYVADFIPDLDTIILQIQQASVKKVLMPNLDPTTIKPLIDLADRYPDLCIPMAGLHPCYVKKDFMAALHILEGWLEKRRFAAIGEVGMDLYHDVTYQGLQEEAFVIQIGWAKRYQLPLIIHTRSALAITLRLLEKHQDGSLTGIFHCFSGTPEEANKIVELGFYLGIGGIITFKNSSLAKTLLEVGLGHVVLETDSPYLAPVPHRGTRNNPSYLPYIAAAIANSTQVSEKAVADITTANAKKIFQLL